ncbi:hypothetical protein GCM10022226_51840 [Sphaerisporangium flaviroseum]|uniref:Transposase n=1 Tax=Sphaerisporangium flaviroseum TaxID=509199 RepID=A0ABP7IRN5_9ACTN
MGGVGKGECYVVYTNYHPVGLSEVSARHDAGTSRRTTFEEIWFREHPRRHQRLRPNRPQLLASRSGQR